MLDRVGNDVDKREGSVIYDACASAAMELHLLYIALDDIMNESFGDTATREFLIRRAKERGITPSPATHAILQGEFTPAGINLTGRRFSMSGTAMTYIVQDKITDGVYRVMSEQYGSQGNRFLDTIIPIEHIAGLQTAALTGVLIPGQDEEATESVRQRYFESFDSYAFGGNVRSYLNETNSIAGVGATKVTPVWAGGGTVKLTILDSKFNPASTTLINTVQEIIDPTGDQKGLGLAPVGHDVTVTTATEITINIEAALVFTPGIVWSILQTGIIGVVENYMLELRRGWARQENIIIHISHIIARILALDGVLNITNTTINGLAEDLTLGEYEIPVLGEIRIRE